MIELRGQIPTQALFNLNRDAITKLIVLLLLLRRVLPTRQIVVTSWWRDPDYNRSVGGNPNSQHVIGTALDVVVVGLTRAQLLPLVASLAAPLGLTTPAEGSATSGNSVHVQALPYGSVQRVLERNPNVLKERDVYV